MAPPAARPLIQGSRTPIANDVATAASTASPPACRTAAPASEARRCADATTPPRVGTTRFLTTCELEKLSIKLGSVLERVSCDIGVRREPGAAFAQALGVADQLVDDPDARAVADDMRVHGELEEPALGMSGGQLAPEDVEDALGR